MMNPQQIQKAITERKRLGSFLEKHDKRFTSTGKPVFNSDGSISIPKVQEEPEKLKTVKKRQKKLSKKDSLPYIKTVESIKEEREFEEKTIVKPYISIQKKRADELFPKIEKVLKQYGKPVSSLWLYGRVGIKSRSQGHIIFRNLLNENKVIKQVHKGKAYYSLEETYQDLYTVKGENIVRDEKYRAKLRERSKINIAHRIYPKVKSRLKHYEKGITIKQVEHADKKKYVYRTYLLSLNYLVEIGALKVRKIKGTNYYYRGD